MPKFKFCEYGPWILTRITKWSPKIPNIARVLLKVPIALFELLGPLMYWLKYRPCHRSKVPFQSPSSKKKNCHLVSFTNNHMISSLLFPTYISLFLCYLNQVHLCHTPFRSTYSLPDCVKICSLANKAWQCPWACSFCELASANWLKQLFLIFGLPCYQPASYM